VHIREYFVYSYLYIQNTGKSLYSFVLKATEKAS
jgi:hypothetical protein